MDEEMTGAVRVRRVWIFDEAAGLHRLGWMLDSECVVCGATFEMVHLGPGRPTQYDVRTMACFICNECAAPDPEDWEDWEDSVESEREDAQAQARDLREAYRNKKILRGPWR